METRAAGVRDQTGRAGGAQGAERGRWGGRARPCAVRPAARPRGGVRGARVQNFRFVGELGLQPACSRPFIRTPRQPQERQRAPLPTTRARRARPGEIKHAVHTHEATRRARRDARHARTTARPWRPSDPSDLLYPSELSRPACSFSAATLCTASSETRRQQGSSPLAMANAMRSTRTPDSPRAVHHSPFQLQSAGTVLSWFNMHG